MAMYNLLENSSDYSKTAGSLWFHSKGEATNFIAGDNNNLKSFEAKILENTAADGNNSISSNSTTTVPLKHLSKF